jgi:vesicle coat complex subunit
MTQSAPQ